MPYTPRIFRDKPDRTTPLNAEALAHMQTQYSEAVADANTYTDGKFAVQGNAATRYQMVACTIRRVDATTWEALNDSGHRPTGVASVARMSDRVRITYDFTAVRVASLTASLDESFAASSVLLRVGASVGINYADVFFYTTSGGSTPIDPGTLSTAGANVWIFGMHEVA